MQKFLPAPRADLVSLHDILEVCPRWCTYTQYCPVWNCLFCRHSFCVLTGFMLPVTLTAPHEQDGGNPSWTLRGDERQLLATIYWDAAPIWNRIQTSRWLRQNSLGGFLLVTVTHLCSRYIVARLKYNISIWCVVLYNWARAFTHNYCTFRSIFCLFKLYRLPVYVLW